MTSLPLMTSWLYQVIRGSISEIIFLVTELIPGNGWFLHMFWSLLGFLEGMVLVHFTWQASSSTERGVKIEREILAQEEVFL